MIINFIILVILFSTLSGKQTKDNEQAIVDEDRWLWTAAWKADEIVTGGTMDSLRLFSSTTYKELKRYFLEGTITKIKWHPYKKMLAVALQGGKSKSSLLNLETRHRIALDSINDFGARAIGWNSTGDILAVGDYDGSLLIYKEDGQLLRKILTGQKGIIGLDWHPSRNLIIAVGDLITTYDVDSDAMNSFEDRPEAVLMLCVAWHPSGEFFVTGDYGDFEKNYSPLLQFWNIDGQRIKKIEESKAEYRELKWSPDGALLSTASEKLRLWDKNGNLIASASSDNLLWGIDWNDKGDSLVTTDEKGKIMIWDKQLTPVKQLNY